MEDLTMKLNEKKYLATDDSVVTLNNEDDFVEYLKFRKENDEWINTFINNLACYGVANLPLFIPGACKNIRIEKDSYKIDVDDIDYELEANRECIGDTGLFLVIPYGNKPVAFPTRPLAYTSICQRAELSCGTMARFDERQNKLVFPIEDKAKWLTRAFQLYGDSCKALYRDGKISALLSKEYKILPCDELIEVLKSELKEVHENLGFEDAMISHEYLIARYALNDKSIEESLRLKLNDFGSNITKLTAGVQFSTSDVGLSSVVANVYLVIDGVRVVLSGISMPHKGDASVENFKDRLGDFGLILQESEERIEELGNLDINDVNGVIKIITEAYPSVFPKAATEQVLSEVRGAGTGIDVFIALNDIINRHTSANNVSPTRYLNMAEQVYSMIRLPFDKIESGEYFFKK